MISPIDPRSVYVIHKAKERELISRIEHIRTAKEQQRYEVVGSLTQLRMWFAQIKQWVELRFNPAAASRQESLTEPCPTVPC